jgi:hypothetical protein
MADRRMFTKKITDSDAFIEMSSAAQALYFHLNQSADDDGFNNQIQMAMFRSHASVDDLKVLMMKNFIIRFESGVIVIKHWRMHNTLRKDRYNPTNFKDELALLNIKDNGAYTLSLSDGCQEVANPVPQVSIGKVSIDKDKKDIVQEACTLFEKVWDLYPNKKGKGQVSDTKKKALLKIGEEELTRAIERYKKHLDANSSWLKPQNGSTFFNSGYVDYLDENYVKEVSNVGSGKQGGNGKPSTENTKRTPTITEMGLQAGLGTEDGDLPFMQ